MSEQHVVPEHQLLLHLQGLDGPRTTAELVAYAESTGAPADVVATLQRLPARRWTSIEDAAAAIGAGWAFPDDDSA